MKIYLDSCILVAFFSKHKEEKEKKKFVKSALELFNKGNDIQLVTSSWAINEMNNILLSRQKDKHKIDFVQECEISLRSKKRLGDVKIDLLSPDGIKKNYDLEDFFYEVGKLNLKYHPGVGDAMHCIIMENNKITHILTFDQKDDFKKVEGLVVINPEKIEIK